MIKMQIRLTTITDVRNFVNTVSRYDVDIDLQSGRYIVDAKSIMGIFSLDLLSPIDMTVHSDNAPELIAELEKYKA